MDEATRAEFWHSLTPEQQKALLSALSGTSQIQAKQKSKVLPLLGCGCLTVSFLVLLFGFKIFGNLGRLIGWPTQAASTAGPWCVLELRNATKWKVPYRYRWDTQQKHFEHAFPDLDPDEIRRECVDFDYSEESHLGFLMRIDKDGSGATLTHDTAVGCTLVTRAEDVAKAPVATYEFVLDEHLLHVRSMGNEARVLQDTDIGTDHNGPFFYDYKWKMPGPPPPKSIPRITIPPREGLFVMSCSKMKTPRFFGF
jgi:hypothetical protein